MPKLINSILASLLLIISAGIYFNADTSCNYQINGYVDFHSNLSSELSISLGYPVLPLEDVKVRVKAKACKYCKWRKWGEVTTDSSGYFEVNKTQSGRACTNGRYIKTQVKFKSSELELRGTSLLLDEFGSGAKWLTISELDKNACKGTSPCELDHLVFRKYGTEKLGDETAVAHAEIWYFYNWAIEHLKNLELPFNKDKNDRIKVVYPLNRLLIPDGPEDSYVSPTTKIVHLTKKPFTLDNIWHELAHVWAFRYTTGEQVMRNYLLTHLNTHGTVRKPEVAFHEGFAEWFMESLKNRYRHEKQVRVDPPKTYVKKLLNSFLNIKENTYPNCEHDLIRSNDKGRLECNEFGWMNILGLANYDDFYHQDDQDQLNHLNLLDISDAPLCEELNYLNCQSRFEINLQHNNQLDCREIPIKLKFSEVLSVINGLDASKLNLNDFLEKISTDYQIANEDIIIFKKVIDPTNEENFNDYYCNNSLVISDYRYELGTWGRAGDKLKKYQGTSVQIKNIGHEKTNYHSFLETPFNQLDPTQMNYSKKIRLKETGQNYIMPGSIKNYLQYLLIDEDLNGSLPVTRLTWKTAVLKKKSIGIFNILLPDLEWKTHQFQFLVGSDYRAESIVIPAYQNEGSLSNNLNKSGGSFDLPSSETNIYISKIRDNEWRLYTNEISENPDELYTNYVGACGAENIGNAPPFYEAKMNVYINHQLVKKIDLPDLQPGQGVLHLFNINLDRALTSRRQQDFNLRCVIDPNLPRRSYGEVREISETNNQSRSTIFSPQEITSNYGINIKRTRNQSDSIEQLKNITSYDNPVGFMNLIRVHQEKSSENITSYIHASNLKNQGRLGKGLLRKIILKVQNAENTRSKNKAKLLNTLTNQIK